MPTLTVAHTGGDGVYLRRTPNLSDRLKAWPDGTKMVRVGEDRAAEGVAWKNVRDPDGRVGWVPAQYLVAAESKPATPEPSRSPTPTPGPTAPGRVDPTGTRSVTDGGSTPVADRVRDASCGQSGGGLQLGPCLSGR